MSEQISIVWATWLQAVAAIFSLGTVSGFSIWTNRMLKRQELASIGETEAKEKHFQEMRRKIAFVAARRLSKIAAALQGIELKASPDMFAMDHLGKGVPDELLVQYLPQEIIYSLFDTYEWIKDVHENIKRMLFESGYSSEQICEFQHEVASRHRIRLLEVIEQLEVLLK